jgi:hypothetical protein
VQAADSILLPGVFSNQLDRLEGCPVESLYAPNVGARQTGTTNGEKLTITVPRVTLKTIHFRLKSCASAGRIAWEIKHFWTLR